MFYYQDELEAMLNRSELTAWKATGTKLVHAEIIDEVFPIWRPLDFMCGESKTDMGSQSGIYCFSIDFFLMGEDGKFSHMVLPLRIGKGKRLRSRIGFQMGNGKVKTINYASFWAEQRIGISGLRFCLMNSEANRRAQELAFIDRFKPVFNKMDRKML